MRVLVVDAYERGDGRAWVTETATAALAERGHRVDVLHLHDLGFATTMSAPERQAYDSGSPLITDATQTSAAAVQQTDALVFCYPTTLFGVPPVLKSWLERVLVEGVAFGFDAKGRIKPAMTNIRRLGAITTSPHSSAATRSARDLGRRTIMWTLRLNCHRLCRRTFVRLASGNGEQSSADAIANALRRW